jgi:hypothetical protein
MSNFSYNTPVGQQGSTTVGGGGGYPLAGFRSILDARLARGSAKTPEAQYPDGYLGSIIDRREDKLLQKVRNNARSYSRGVHKGSKIANDDYFWPEDFNPYSTLEARMAGDRAKFAPTGNPIERLAHAGKWLSAAEVDMLRREANIAPDPQMRIVDPEIRKAGYRNLPSWR